MNQTIAKASRPFKELKDLFEENNEKATNLEEKVNKNYDEVEKIPQVEQSRKRTP